MTFRSSRFIDFNQGTVKIAPMELIKSDPKNWNIDQKLEFYECMVEVWQLGPAVAILQEIESHEHPSAWSHSAYALLSVVFTYFEMVGKSLNPNSQSQGTAGWDFNCGFCDVYPSFAPLNGDFRDKLPQGNIHIANPDIQKVLQIRDRLRNGIYHLGYTKASVQIHNERPVDFEEVVVPDPSNANSNLSTCRVNPHSLVRTIVNHFPSLMVRLQDNNNTALRSSFESYFDQFIV